MAEVVDGRSGEGLGTVSKKRFVDRLKRHARKALYKSIEKGNITDIGEDGVDVIVNRDDLNEPVFHHGKGGTTRRVHPGNKEFTAGEKIRRPQGGGGNGGGKGEASDSGEGMDEFIFHMSKEEFLDLLFEDLGLPNMRRLNVQQTSETKPKFAGLASSGPLNRLDRKRSKRRKMGRIMAAEAPYNRDIAANLREVFGILSKYDPEPAIAPRKLNGYDDFVPLKIECQNLRRDIAGLKEKFYGLASPDDQARIKELEAANDPLEGRKKLVPSFNKSTDMRVRQFPPTPVPQNRSVMFCVMDVSGSMDEEKKTNAKLFFFLLYTFLKRNYRDVDIVFVRHHTSAKEVDEQEFFYGQETGGTVVSPALQMVDDIYQQRYAGKNHDVYVAQASDGDNFRHDNPRCGELMRKILTYARGAFYTEITRDAPQELWETYQDIKEENPDNFWIGRAEERKDIWPLFRQFFSKTYSFGSASGTRPAVALAPAA